MRKCWFVRSVLLSVFLWLPSCAAPSVMIGFAMPERGLDLNVPSLPVDVMVLNQVPKDEAALADKLRKPQERSKWFNEQAPELKTLRDRLRRQGKLFSTEVKRGQREAISFALSVGDTPEGAVLVVVADIPLAKENESQPMDSTSILEGKDFTITLVGDRIRVRLVEDK